MAHGRSRGDLGRQVELDPSVAPALRRLARVDRDLGRAWKLVGPLPDRSRPPGFATLLKIIVEQQLSTASADAIWTRLACLAQPMAARDYLALDDGALRACGLSRPKIAYLRHLAEAVADGALDLAGLAQLDDAAARAELVKVKGIGRWTAEIYLLFALGRHDIWPAGDLALMNALQHLKRMRSRPTLARMDRLAEPWRPHRGAAARLLWSYWRLVRQKPKL